MCRGTTDPVDSPADRTKPCTGLCRQRLLSALSTLRRRATLALRATRKVGADEGGALETTQIFLSRVFNVCDEMEQCDCAWGHEDARTVEHALSTHLPLGASAKTALTRLISFSAEEGEGEAPSPPPRDTPCRRRRRHGAA